ncbi:nuclease-related domain-containing protein [Plantactinospora sp. ZYX-F-223]|uniref:nuclease-related domain-containing protein n=1 Tax=Plantactinospora sp. ZYX-F-223 TaxID=3144103 RepID=UPI0031FD113D
MRELASYLPDAHPYHVWANVEFVGTDGSINEIDALVLTRSGLYVVELKHWQGVIEGSGTHWTRQLPRRCTGALRWVKRCTGPYAHRCRSVGVGHQALGAEVGDVSGRWWLGVVV